MTVNDRIKHFFHVVSNVRPLVWICLYVALMPVFACIYNWMPAGQFRIPDGGETDWGSWLYYSIVTLTTLGFGDYTPAMKLAQAVTAIEVMCGLVILGLFLNAVGSMKSEIDVASEVEKQRRTHEALENEKLQASVPGLLHTINMFLSYCYAVTTPLKDRATDKEYNPDFKFSDMCDMFKPTGLAFDTTRLPAVSRLIGAASRLSLSLDSLQGRVDLTLWPTILEDSFTFVANFQMFNNVDSLSHHSSLLQPGANVSDESQAEAHLSGLIAGWQGEPKPLNEKTSPDDGELHPVFELYYYIKENAAVAEKLEAALTTAVNQE